MGKYSSEAIRRRKQGTDKLVHSILCCERHKPKRSGGCLFHHFMYIRLQITIYSEYSKKKTAHDKRTS